MLFGGTFDPPHFGHVHNLKHAIEFVNPDKIIVMPAGVPPHKAKSETSSKLRLEMCECFLKELPSEQTKFLQISDWEIKRSENGFANYTIDTLLMLKEKFKGASLYLTVGSDMLLNFHIWKNWQEILQVAFLVVETRQEGDTEELQNKMAQLDPSGERILLNDIKALEMQSKTLREKLEKGEDCTKFLPKNVLKVIKREKLYTKKELTLKQAKQLAKQNQSKKRYQHTLNVRKMAISLAEVYGENVEKAELAALLHDVLKEKNKEELLRILEDDVIISDNAKNRPFPVWHGVCAAIIAKTEWGITDEEVLSAIACHTTGKPNMSLLDKIIYLSDMLCEERDFEGVETLRKLAFEDIDRAMLAALKSSLDFVKASGKPLDTVTLETYQNYNKFK